MTNHADELRDMANDAGLHDTTITFLHACADEFDRLHAHIIDLEDRLLATGQWHAKAPTRRRPP